MQNALCNGIVGVGMILGLASFSQPANAQSIGPVSIEMEGWAYVPVLADTDQSVQAIVALRINDPDAAISALYCERDAAGNWRAQAWGDVPMEEVAASVFDSLGAELEDGSLEEMYDAWPMDLDETALLAALAAPVDPVPFGDGVALGDPFEQIVQVSPEVLEPLESTGYPAVARMSGSAVTGGTFTSNPVNPQPIDDCLRASELLNALHAGFSASAIDGDAVDAAFEAASLLINSNCTCPVRTTTTTNPWVDTCGPWNQVGGATAVGTDCRYNFERAVSGTQTRVQKRTNSDCSKDMCTQTRFRNGIQSGQSLSVTAPGIPCPAAGPLPPAGTCKCSGLITCQTGPWIPVECIWVPCP